MDSWIPYSPHIAKSTLVFVGNDGNGTPLYVGRAHHNGDLIPGKVLSNHKCHISYNMEEIAKDSFEVLVNCNYEWRSASDGNVPAGAIVGGRTKTGETLYVGRASHCGITTPGKVHPSHRCLYLPFGWKEHRYTHYEVLCSRSAVCPPCIPPAQPIHPPHINPPIVINPFPPSFPLGPGHHRPHCPPGKGHHRGGHHGGPHHHHRHGHDHHKHC